MGFGGAGSARAGCRQECQEPKHFGKGRVLECRRGGHREPEAGRRAASTAPELCRQRRDASGKGKGKAEGRSWRGLELKKAPFSIEEPSLPEGKRKEQKNMVGQL